MPNRSHQPPIVRNTTFNLVGVLVPSLLQVITIPASIQLLGIATYGIFTLLVVLFAQFGVFDFGVGKATIHRLSLASNTSETARQEIIATSVICVLVLGVMAGLLLLFLGEPLFGLIGNHPGVIPAEIRSGLGWLSLLLPLTLLGSVFSSVLESRGRFGELSVINASGAIISQLAPLSLALVLQPTIDIFVAGVCAGRLVATLGSGVLAFRELDGFRLGSARWARATDLIGYGGWVTTCNTLAPLIHSGDQLVIARLLGASAVTHYAVPFSVCQKMLLLPSSLIRTLFPQMARLDLAAAKGLAERSAVVLMCLLALVIGPGFFLVHPGLDLWLSNEFADMATLSTQMLLLGFALNGVGHVPFALLQSRGRPATVAKLYLAEILPFFGILWLLTTHFGLFGAACAWVLRAGFDLLAMALFCRFSAAFYYRVGALTLLLTVIFLGSITDRSASQAFSMAILSFVVCAGIAATLSRDLRVMVSRHSSSIAQRIYGSKS